MGVHIRLGNIPGSDQSLKLSILLCNRQGHGITLLHDRPGVFNRNTAGYPRRLPDLHILHLRTHIRQIPRCLHPKTLQHILCLTIDLSCPLCKIPSPITRTILNIRISDGRADRIRIRIFMAHYIDLPLFCHFRFLSLTSI